jgi:PPM family protein phosphatase
MKGMSGVVPTPAGFRPLRVAQGCAVMFSQSCPGSDGPNEDTAALLSLDEHHGVLLVADGLGGRPGGELASRIAVEAIEWHVRKSFAGTGSLRDAILEGIDAANRQIMDLGIGAGTTLAVVELSGSTVRGYHVGDAEILACGQRGRIKYQTVSHSPTSYAVESGLLDQSEALDHADRHLVSNVIGDSCMRIEIGSTLGLASRDTLVVGTDGLFDNLHAREIVDIVRTGSLEDAANRLSGFCLERMREPRSGLPSKPDDLTFIIYRPVLCTASDVRLPYPVRARPASSGSLAG